MFNGKPTREWLSGYYTSSTTASLEDVFKTETIDVYEIRYIITMNVPNACIQTNMPPNKYGEEGVIIKTSGVLVDIIFELNSDTYRKHVVF